MKYINENSYNQSTLQSIQWQRTDKTRYYFYTSSAKLKITLNKKAFSSHHKVDKFISPLISPPEAADPTNAWRLFPPVFRKGRMKGQDGMTSNVACHATLWTENSNEHPKTRDQQKYDIEIPQNRLV